MHVLVRAIVREDCGARKKHANWTGADRFLIIPMLNQIGVSSGFRQPGRS